MEIFRYDKAKLTYPLILLLMSLDFTFEQLRELRRFPRILAAIQQASSKPDQTVALNLAKMAYDNPFALTEAVLYARTLGVTLVLKPRRSRPRPAVS